MYNIQYYTRDTARNQPPVEVYTADRKQFVIAESDYPEATPAEKNPDVERYDPTGTRTALTTSQGIIKSLFLSYCRCKLNLVAFCSPCRLVRNLLFLQVIIFV